MGNNMQKTALVTGGAGELGSAVVKCLVKDGYRVAIADKNAEGAKTLAAELKGTVAIPFDALDVADCGAMLATAKETLGSIDVIVHAVSKRVYQTLIEMDAAEWAFVFKTNFYSLANVFRAAAPILREQGYGRVIHINSRAGKMGAYGESACSAAMHACRAYVRAAAAEYGKHGIRVNAICVGDMPELKSWQEATAGLDEMKKEELKLLANSKYFAEACAMQDVTGLVEYLISDAAKFVTGQALNLTGGNINF